MRWPRPRSAAVPTPGTCPWCSGRSRSRTTCRASTSSCSTARPSGRSSTARITTWNDPAIAALNPGATLPADEDQRGLPQRRVRHHRQLPEVPRRGVGRRWGKGAGKTFNGGVGEGAKGNEGTSAAIKNADGSITYNEWSFAKAQDLQIASIVTSAGPDPVDDQRRRSVGKTIESAKVKGSGNDLVLDTSSFYKPTQTGAYPIVLATYEIVCSKYADADTGKAVKSFLTTTIGPGQDGLADNGYIPIPDQFKSKLTRP